MLGSVHIFGLSFAKIKFVTKYDKSKLRRTAYLVLNACICRDASSMFGSSEH